MTDDQAIDEADVVLLGLRLVLRYADEELAEIAERAMSRLATARGDEVEPDRPVDPETASRVVRTAVDAVRAGSKLRLSYSDRKGRMSGRTVWPLGVTGTEPTDLLFAYCESRQDFRHFRFDRIEEVKALADVVPVPQRVLLWEWDVVDEQW